MTRPILVSGLLSTLVVMATPVVCAEMTGQDAFEHYCAPCHGTADGPGTMQLSRTRGKDQALLVERHNLTPDYIEYVVRHGLKAMPPFVPSDLTDENLRALTAFLTKSH